jgi:hypothetical protein
MRLATENSDQMQSVFGGIYVLEHHADETHRYLLTSEKHDFAMDFEAMLKRLRSALAIG